MYFLRILKGNRIERVLILNSLVGAHFTYCLQDVRFSPGLQSSVTISSKKDIITVLGKITEILN